MLRKFIQKTRWEKGPNRFFTVDDVLSKPEIVYLPRVIIGSTLAIWVGHTLLLALLLLLFGVSLSFGWILIITAGFTIVAVAAYILILKGHRDDNSIFLGTAIELKGTPNLGYLADSRRISSNE